MAITDFIQSVLSGLGTAAGAVGRGIQAAAPYAQNFAENVAPIFDTKNWSENLIRIHQLRQQQQEQQARADQLGQQSDLEERKFAQQQQYQQSLINDAQARTQLEALTHGFGIPGQQSAQGGPGLNGGNAESQIGAGGGNNMPTQSPGPNNVMALGPYYAFMNGGGGQQQSGGFGVNQPNQGPAGQTPANRVLTPTAYSGDGGGPATPNPPVVPTVFTLANGLKVTMPSGGNLAGSVPVSSLPKELQPFFAGQDRADISDVQKMTTAAKEQGLFNQTTVKEPTNKEELFDRLTAQHFDPKAKSVVDLPDDKVQDAIKYMQNLEGAPSDTVAAQLKDLQLKRAQQEAQIAAATKSPEAIDRMVNSLRQNPDAIHELSPEARSLAESAWINKTGLPIPTKLDNQSQTTEQQARNTQNSINRILQFLDDPDTKLRQGPWMGRLGKAEENIGDVLRNAHLTDAQIEKIQNYRTDMNNLFFSEAQTVLHGRPAVLLAQQLKSTSPNVNMITPMLKGALNGLQDTVNNRMFSVEQSRFGGKVRPWAYDMNHNVVAGQLWRGSDGRLHPITEIGPNGPIL